MPETRGQWGSRFGFILAAAGSAVGLGNIWKFPYITGENGGGWFVLIYLLCIALVGLPILMSEILIGRAGQKHPVLAFSAIRGRPTGWSVIGWMGLLTGFLILSFYVVVAGWTMDYTLKSVVGFTKPAATEARVEAMAWEAATPIDAMRESIVDRRSARATGPIIDQIRTEAPPSAWRAFDELVGALQVAASAGGTTSIAMIREGDPTVAAMRAADPELDDALNVVQPLLPQLEAAARDVREETTAEVARMSDVDVRTEATTIERRRILAARMGESFGALLTDGWTSAVWAAVFMLVTITIVAAGVGRGIEAACRWMMPTLFVVIVGMVIYGAFLDGFGEAVSFVFSPNAERLRPSGVLEALGHAFFTLSVGMGALITYGSYQKSKSGILGESIAIVVLDTLIALLACLMMFPIIFSFDQDPAAGPGLVFMSMPLAFAELGGPGMLLATVFFGLLTIAALTSAISLLEVCASYLIDALGMSRVRAAISMGAAVYLVSMLVAFSNSEGFVLSSWSTGYGMSFFDTLDIFTSNWLLPLGGLLIAVYAGWFLPRRMRDAELTDVPAAFVTGWLTLVRFVAPLLVLVVLAQKIGLLDANEFFHALLH